jgi:tRNA-guanine transglycosylase
VIEFAIQKKSSRSQARLGQLTTPHGTIETPTLVPVATQGVVKALTSEQVVATKTHILIANTFHLHLRPGETVVRAGGGLHDFMRWPKPLMTDSGGFQVFSLGFGRDLQMGKVIKDLPSRLESIEKHDQPAEVKITEEGAYFKSPHDGRTIFLGPRESIAIQEQLGADIIFAFDECTPPRSTPEYLRESVARTHRWAQVCLEARQSSQALFGITQGSTIQALREESAQYINNLGFDGFGIGGDLGHSKADTQKVLAWTIPYLDETKPRHLLGIGHLEDMELIAKGGIDLFDCTVPTHYGRRGIAFTSEGKLNMSRSIFLKDRTPLDQECECMVCGTYTRSYLCHLLRAKEITALSLLSFHNLFFFNTAVEKLRVRIKNGIL